VLADSGTVPDHTPRIRFDNIMSIAVIFLEITREKEYGLGILAGAFGDNDMIGCSICASKTPRQRGITAGYQR